MYFLFLTMDVYICNYVYVHVHNREHVFILSGSDDSTCTEVHYAPVDIFL